MLWERDILYWNRISYTGKTINGAKDIEWELDFIILILKENKSNICTGIDAKFD